MGINLEWHISLMEREIRKRYKLLYFVFLPLLAMDLTIFLFFASKGDRWIWGGLESIVWQAFAFLLFWGAILPGITFIAMSIACGKQDIDIIRQDGISGYMAVDDFTNNML